MSEPPVGYDDDSVIPKRRLASMLTNFEESLETVERVFEQSLPTDYEAPGDFKDSLELLKVTATEVGTDYTFLVDKLLKDYEDFSKAPDEEKLKQLFSDVKSLQLLLVG